MQSVTTGTTGVVAAAPLPPAIQTTYTAFETAPPSVALPDAAKTQLPPSASRNPSLSSKIDTFAEHHVCADAIKPFFMQFAAGREKLDYDSARDFFHTAAKHLLGVPLGHFDLNREEFLRFDFDGDGGLCFKEAAKCFRRNMIEMQKQIGGCPVIPVPNKTPEQAGYTVVKTLASGGQGSIALATSSDKGQVALKIYEKNNANAGGIDELRGEMEAMRVLEKCPCIMHCYEIFQDEQHFYCVDELLPGGDLCSLREIADRCSIPLTEQYFRRIFQQCMTALDYMHRHCMMHCDIKEPNIMFKTRDWANPEIALIDFGMAKWSSSDGLAGGTPGYRPPETNETNIWFPAGDIFCMGVTFFQVLADKTPCEKTMKAGIFTEGAQTLEQVNYFVKNREPPIGLLQVHFPAVLLWLPAMLDKDPLKRPKAPRLLQDQWFQGPCAGVFFMPETWVSTPIAATSPELSTVDAAASLAQPTFVSASPEVPLAPAVIPVAAPAATAVAAPAATAVVPTPVVTLAPATAVVPVAAAATQVAPLAPATAGGAALLNLASQLVKQR